MRAAASSCLLLNHSALYSLIQPMHRCCPYYGVSSRMASTMFLCFLSAFTALARLQLAWFMTVVISSGSRPLSSGASPDSSSSSSSFDGAAADGAAV